MSGGPPVPERRFKPGDRVAWLPFWEDDPVRFITGEVVPDRPGFLAGYDYAVQLDGDDLGPTAVYDRELRSV